MTEFKQHTGLLSPWVDGMRIRKVAAHIPAGSEVLDIGCGPAFLAAHLPAGCRYTGVDRDPELIKSNKSRLPAHEFLSFDATSSVFPIPPNQTDVIVMAAFLEHITNPRVLLSECGRVLKWGGIVVATTPSSLGGKVHDILAHLGMLSHDAAEEHEGFLDKPQMEKFLQYTGLKLKRYEPFQFGLNQLFILEKGR